MAKPGVKSVDEDIASKPTPAQAALNLVRAAIREAVPDAQELISYDMPTYKLRGVPLVRFAGWEEHVALYGATPPVAAAFHEELRGYEIGKGTIRFPLHKSVPAPLIGRIVSFLARR
ncbi:MAG: iron chaperone [Vulcanimicrobiaceae bacterium]